MNRTANNLKTLRVKANLSQADLAKVLGVSRSAVSSYENGTRRPNHEVLVKLAVFYNVSTDFLLGNAPQPSKPDLIDELSFEIRKLLDTANLDSSNKAEILSELKDYFQWKLSKTSKR